MKSKKLCKKSPEDYASNFRDNFLCYEQQKGKEMKQHIFTQEERSELENNPHIIKVMNCNVEYTEAFKQQVMHEHEELGKSAKQIFTEAEIPDWLNKGKYFIGFCNNACRFGKISHIAWIYHTNF